MQQWWKHEQKQQCFFYQANLETICDLNHESSGKNAHFNNQLIILKDSAEQNCQNPRVCQESQDCQDCPISFPQTRQPASGKILTSLDYIREQNVSDEESNAPGAVVYERDGDRIMRKNAASFGPGDLFCSIWNLLGMAGLGVAEWTPQYTYWQRPENLDDGGANLID